MTAKKVKKYTDPYACVFCGHSVDMHIRRPTPSCRVIKLGTGEKCKCQGFNRKP
jgi:hypothetical protein